MTLLSSDVEVVVEMSVPRLTSEFRPGRKGNPDEFSCPHFLAKIGVWAACLLPAGILAKWKAARGLRYGWVGAHHDGA